MMSGTIVLGDGTDWSASSGIFSLVIDYLAHTVDDQATRDVLRLIDEQNFGWLDVADLSDIGRQQVLSRLGQELVTYAAEQLPATAYKQDAIAKVGELVELGETMAS
jgi:hypothetical protein